MWAYVLILIIGVAVTVLGIRIGQRRREDPFADVRSEAEASEPEPFASRREPEPTASAEDLTGAARAPRATLEERLREAQDARAAKTTSAVEREAASAGSPAVEAAATPIGTAAAPSPLADPSGGTTGDSVEPSEMTGAADLAAATATEAVEPERRVEAEERVSTAEAVSAASERLEPGAVPSSGSTPPDVTPTPAAVPEPTAPSPRAPEGLRVELRPLDGATRDAFAQRWTPLRMRLLARPGGAIADAEVFVRELLEARGLPTDPGDPAMVEASNAYPDIVDPFRLASAIARHAADGFADPQQLRLATVHYRDTVDRLLADEPPA